MNGISRQVSLVILTLIMLYTNLLSGSGGGFQEDAGNPAIYFLYPTSFTPAPFTFAIWLPIFLSTIALAIFQALPSQRHSRLLDQIALPYAIALIANSMSAYTDIGLSNLVVLTLFVTLAISYGLTLPFKPRRAERRFVQIPLALFATWAALATILNACQFVVSRGWEVGPIAASVLIAITMAMGMFAVFKTKEAAIAIVMVWAGIGIAAANLQSPLVVSVIVVTTFGTILIAARNPRRHYFARRTD